MVSQNYIMTYVFPALAYTPWLVTNTSIKTIVLKFFFIGHIVLCAISQSDSATKTDLWMNEISQDLGLRWDSEEYHIPQAAVNRRGWGVGGVVWVCVCVWGGGGGGGGDKVSIFVVHSIRVTMILYISIGYLAWNHRANVHHSVRTRYWLLNGCCYCIVDVKWIQYILRNMHTVLLCFALLWLCNRS